jgi:ferredoxin
MSERDSYVIVLETPEGEYRFECGRNDFIWNAAARNGIRLPSICHQGRCLTCAGRVLSGNFDQSRADTYFPQDRDAGFILLCTAKPLSDLRILTHQQWQMREHRQALKLPAPYS